MPRTISAKKALRQSQKRYLRNLQRKRRLKTLEKRFRKALKEKQQEEALKYLNLIYKTVDKLIKVGFLKKNTGNRKKSRLHLSFNKIFRSVKST